MTRDVSLRAFEAHLRSVKSEQTARKYKHSVVKFHEFMREQGCQSVADITTDLVNNFIEHLSNIGWKPSTIRVTAFAVRKYLSWLESKGLEVANPKVELPKNTVRMRGVLAQDKLTEFFRTTDRLLEEPVRTAVMLLPCCGLRANEMVNLRLNSIQRAQVKLQPKGNKARHKTTFFLTVLGKGDKERHVPLMEEGVEILIGYLVGWRKRQPGFWLFPSLSRRGGVKPGKRPISDHALRDGVNAVREAMGENFTPHTMRRTYITTLWRKKIDIGTVARIAGHKNIQTTLDHYISMDASDSLDALHQAGSALLE